MTLSFKTHFDDGSKTLFREKIWSGLQGAGMWMNNTHNRLEFARKYNWRDALYYPPSLKASYLPKIHTIREDPNCRWKVGNKIHFVTGNRTPDRHQFAPVIKCTNIQKVFMTYPGYGDKLHISVGSTYLHYPEQEQLAINDGFRDYNQFFDYFLPLVKAKNDSGYSCRLIHWITSKDMYQ
jgi:hypothetical protein